MIRYEDGSIIFEQKDLEKYCEDSGDRNPLHMDISYSQSTIYGEQVVFGMLGVETLLKEYEISATRLDVKFNTPLFLGRRYYCSKKDKGDTISLSLLECNTVLLEVKLSNKELKLKNLGKEAARQLPMFDRARDLMDSEIEGEKIFSGKYTVPALKQMKKGDEREFLCQIQRLYSYLVGMVLPGKRALFMKASTYAAGAPTEADSWDYRITQSGYHDVLGLVDYQVEVFSDSELIAIGKIQAYIRVDFNLEEKPLEIISQELEGERILILGGTKGLGAEIAKYYTARGASVIMTYQNGQERAEAFYQYLARVSDQVELIKSDVGSLEDCQQLKDYLEKKDIKIDRLFLCAAQSPKKIEFYPENYPRFEDYLTKGVKMFYYPFFTLRDQVVERGKIVILSSIATVEKQFFHNITEYICVKSIVENISECSFYKNLDEKQYFIIRPNQMLTEMNNTPAGRVGSEKPETIAAKLIQAIEEEETEGRLFKYIDFN